MGIVDDDIAAVRQATDIVAVVSAYTQLRKVGQRWSGLCPFHPEKTPSFSVNSVDGLYHCFGCKASGDAITFVRELEHLDFVGAVELLAGRFGVQLHYTERDEGEGRKRQTRLFELTDRAAAWYHERLRTGADAAPARAYLRSRGFDGDLVAQYRIGWAPDAWDLLVRDLRAPQADIESCGLGFKNRAGRMQDFFRARVLFPIYDERNRVIGFGGRKLPDADGPKYQNSRDNDLYKKSKALYGINWAKADAVASNEVVICEGYTDVIGFRRAGVGQAVATCGTALTEDHVVQLKRFTRRLVLAYDADEAGRSASDRVYAWEKAHDISVSVVGLPPGADPDELSRSDPQALRTAVAEARPFLEFRVDRVLAAADLDSLEGQARAADAALTVVAEHPDALTRDNYVMRVADVTRANVDALRSRLEEIRRSPRRSEPPPSRRGDDGRSEEPLPDEPPTTASNEAQLPPLRDGVEREALRLAIHRRDLAESYLDESLFAHETARAALGALQSTNSVAEAVDVAPPEVRELLSRLSVEPLESESSDVLARLASENGRRELRALEAEARSAADPLDYAEAIKWLKVTLDDLRHPNAEVETVTQLLAFLKDRRQDAIEG